VSIVPDVGLIVNNAVGAVFFEVVGFFLQDVVKIKVNRANTKNHLLSILYSFLIK
jgi:hypothetical protein